MVKKKVCELVIANFFHEISFLKFPRCHCAAHCRPTLCTLGPKYIWNCIQLLNQKFELTLFPLGFVTYGNKKYPCLKVAFFQKKWFVFLNLQISKNKYSKKLNLKFKFSAKNTLLLLAANLNFTFRIVFWNNFFL